MLALEVDPLVAPAGPDQRDGLVRAPAAILEPLAKRLELGRLPADTDAEPRPAAGQRVERAELLRHQHRLALRQHQDLGAKADPMRDGGHVGQRRHGFEDGHPWRVEGFLAAVDVVAHHDMVEDIELVVADILDALRQARDVRRTFAIGDAGKFDGQFHVLVPQYDRGNPSTFCAM